MVRPTPTYTAPATGWSTAYTVMFGEVSWNSGTHWPSASVWASGGPKTSSTKLSSAWRWSSSLRTVFNPCRLPLEPPRGSPNHALLAVDPSVRPIACASEPKAPRLAASRFIGPPDPVATGRCGTWPERPGHPWSPLPPRGSAQPGACGPKVVHNAGTTQEAFPAGDNGVRPEGGDNVGTGETVNR